MTGSRRTHDKRASLVPAYSGLVSDISNLLDSARRTSARAVNSILTATYWEIGRCIVEYEQAGKARAEYGDRLLARLARDLEPRFGRAMRQRTLYSMRSFYLDWSIGPTSSVGMRAREILQSPIAESGGAQREERIPVTIEAPGRRDDAESQALQSLAAPFPLAWSHYVRLRPADRLLAFP